MRDWLTIKFGIGFQTAGIIRLSSKSIPCISYLKSCRKNVLSVARLSLRALKPRWFLMTTVKSTRLFPLSAMMRISWLKNVCWRRMFARQNFCWKTNIRLCSAITWARLLKNWPLYASSLVCWGWVWVAVIIRRRKTMLRLPSNLKTVRTRSYCK